MNLAELRGGVIMRLAPREKILIPAVDIELHNAIDDIRADARHMRVQTLDLVAYVDAVADMDVYDYPEGAEEIRDVFTLRAGKTPIPMVSIAFREQPIVDWVGYQGAFMPQRDFMPYTYVLLPNRKIRVMNTPTTSTEDAFMIRYFPGPTRMVKATDEPRLPRQVHENLIPQAVMRLASYDGIHLVHPASFDRYRASMEMRLAKFLQPSTVDATNYVLDVDGYYSGGG